MNIRRKRGSATSSLLSIALSMVLVLGLMPTVAMGDTSEADIASGETSPTQTGESKDATTGSGVVSDDALPGVTGDEPTGVADGGEEPSDTSDISELSDSVSLLAAVPAVGAGSAATRAAVTGGGTITLKGTDDNGAFDAEPAGQTAAMSWTSANNAANPYTFIVNLSGLTPGAGKSVSIELAEGMRFVSYGFDATNGTSWDTPTTTNFARSDYMNATNPWAKVTNGINRGVNKVTATLKAGVTDTYWSFTISPDTALMYENISDAVKVTYSAGGTDTTLGFSADVTIPGHSTSIGLRQKAVANNSTTAFTVAEDGDNAYFGFTSAGAGVYANYSITYTCPAGVTLALKSGTEDRFSLTDNGGGSYTLTTLVPSYSSSGNLEEPVDYVVAAAPGITQLDIAATKTLTTLDGATVKSCNTPRRLLITNDAEDVYLGYNSNGSYLGTSSRVTNATTNMQVRSAHDGQSSAGVIYMGNAGNTASAAKTTEMHFNGSIGHVYGVPLMLPAGNSISSIQYQSGANSTWQTASIRTITGMPGFGGWVTSEDLGLANGDYITALKYELGSIPANSFINVASGRHYVAANDCSTGTIGTVEVYDTATPSNTTGAANLNITVAENSYLRVSNPASQLDHATGDTITLSTQFSEYWSASDSYRYYVKVPVGATVANAKLASFGETIALDATGPFTGSDGSRYYAIDATKLAADTSDAHAGYGAVGEQVLSPKTGQMVSNWPTLSFDIKTSKTDTPAGDYDYNKTLFIEDTTLAPGSVTTDTYRAGVAGNAGIDQATGALMTFNSPNLYRLKGAQEVVATADGKHQNATAWTTYDGTENTYTQIGLDTVFNMRTQISNKSGSVASAGTTVWQPVPKAGEDWSSLSKSKDIDGSDIDIFPFSVSLKSKLTNPNPAKYKISYGIGVTPGDTEASMATGTWVPEGSLSIAQLASVNCYKIECVDTIPDGTLDSFIADVVADAGQGYMENSVDVASPLVKFSLTTPDGIVANVNNGSAVAIQLVLGRIHGTLFNDTDRDGVWDSSEAAIDGTTNGGYTVSIYKKADASRTPVQTVPVKADGTYFIKDLCSADLYEDYYGLQLDNATGGLDIRVPNGGPIGTGEIEFTSVTNTDGASTGNAFAHGAGFGLAVPANAVKQTGENWDAANGGVYNAGIVMQLYNADTFQADTTKGTMADADPLTWMTVANTTSGNTAQKVYRGLAVDSLVWPTVTAKHGYTFDGWKIDNAGSLIAQPAAGVALGYDDTTYVAQFSEVEYTVTYAAGTNGNVSGGPETVKYQANATMTGVTATPDAGYHQTGWDYVVANGTATPTTGTTDDPTTVTITGDATFTAVFAEDDDVTLSYESADTDTGSVSPASQDVAPATGTATGSTATAEYGYHFTNWTNDKDATKTTDAVLTQAQVDAVAKADGVYEATTFTAHFALNDYQVTYAAGANGSVSGGPETVKYQANATMAGVTASADTNYYATGWDYTMDNGTATPTTGHVQDPTTVTITGNATFTATFAEELVVLYAKGDHGAFAENVDDATLFAGLHSGDAKPGFAGETDSATTNAQNAGNPKAQMGYHFTGWTPAAVDPVTGNQTYTAQWAANTYDITYATSDAAKGTVSGSGTSETGVAFGANPAFTSVTVAPAYGFEQPDDGTNWHYVITHDDGTTTEGDTDDPTSVAVAGSIAFTANFKARDFKVSFDTDGGMPATIADIEVAYGNVIMDDTDFPTDPVKSGNVFQGWQVVSIGGAVQVDVMLTPADEMPVGNVALKAVWVERGHVSGTIGANDFDYLTGSTQPDITADAAIDLARTAASANGVALDASDIEVNADQLAAINAAKDAGKVGPYPLTFTNTVTGDDVTITVTLRDVVIPPADGKDSFGGNPFDYGVKNSDSTVAADLTAADILAKSFASAYDSRGAAYDVTLCTVDTADLAALNAAKNAGTLGTYDVKVTTPGKTYADGTTSEAVTGTIKVTLFSQTVVGDDYRISANDFTRPIADGALDDATAKGLAGTTLTDKYGNELDLAGAVVDDDQLDAINAAIANGEAGVLPLTWTAPDGTTSVTINVTLTGEVALAVTKTAAPTTIEVGQQVIYTITVTNTGSIDAKGYFVADKLADGLQYASSDPTFTTQDADGTYYWKVDVPRNGGTKTITVVATATNAGAIGNTARVYAATEDDPSIPDTTTTLAEATVGITVNKTTVNVGKTADKTEFRPGENMTYTLTVNNPSNDTAYGIYVKDYVPANTTFVSCDENGTYGVDPVTGKTYVTWFLDSLAAGASQTLTMTVKVNECQDGTKIENTALFEVTGKPTPPDPSVDPDPENGGGGSSSTATGTVKDSVVIFGHRMPKTGDTAPLFVVGLVAVVAAGAAALSLAKRRSGKTGRSGRNQ